MDGDSDEHSITRDNRTIGYFGHRSSSVLLAWLASHRGRLSTLLLGGHKLSILVVWDRKGNDLTGRTVDDDAAIYRLAYGENLERES